MSRTEAVDVTGAEGPRPPAPRSRLQRLGEAVGLGDVIVVIGLVLWVIAFWGAWRIALGVPAAVLVAWALPPRPPFVLRDTPRGRG